MKDIGVIGAGSWGTALSDLLAKNGHRVHLWCYEDYLPEQINQHRENDEYLPNIELPENIEATNDKHAVITDKDLILSVMPSHVVRTTWKGIADEVPSETPIVSATKGIENDTLMLVSEIFEDLLGDTSNLAYLSGPSFAREVAKNKPTAVTVAAKNHDLAVTVQDTFSTDYFRCYTSTDVVGVELGGSLKNVIAIAAGAVSGMNLGLNAMAGMITRGIHEITKLATALGAEERTIRGLSGMGDLILTCTGGLSRNRTFGEKLGQGIAPDTILNDMNMVAEGVKTSKSVHDLANEHGVEMPISEQVYRVLYEGKDAEQAVKDLMMRELKHEYE